MSMFYKKTKDSKDGICMGRVRRCISIETGKGFTEQSHKNECNMNLKVRRVLESRAVIPERKIDQENIIDMTNVPDFQAAMNAIADAHSTFERLPIKERLKYGNSPAKFIDGLTKEAASMRLKKENERIKKENDELRTKVNKKDKEPPKNPD